MVFRKVAVPAGETPQMHGGHGAPNNNETWALRSQHGGKQPASSRGGTAFGGANGGEYRKSFHGYPPGTAQLINSPHSFVVTPMQIDTWNRDKMYDKSNMNLKNVDTCLPCTCRAQPATSVVQDAAGLLAGTSLPVIRHAATPLHLFFFFSNPVFSFRSY